MACCQKPPTGERVFLPNYSFKALTEKFYARHDNIEEIRGQLNRIPYFEEEIEKRLCYDARKKYLFPITENQSYGWYEYLSERYTGLDREILMHPILCDEVMQVEKKIALDVMQEKQWNKL